MELRIRGTQNEKTNFAGTHFSENKIREQSVNRTHYKTENTNITVRTIRTTRTNHEFTQYAEPEQAFTAKSTGFTTIDTAISGKYLAKF